jgi:hypothetical protein
VKGHFSGKHREPQHDLNAIAHNLAVSALTLVPQESPDISPPSSLVDLRRGNILTSQWRAVIQEAAHADLLKDTILRNASWSDDQFDMVDWEALRMYLKGLSRVSLFSYCKLLHGILNTNQQNNRFYGKPSSCPHCNSGPESFLHVVSCPHPEVKDYRRKQQEVLWKSLQKLRTPVTVLQYMKYGILSCDPLVNMETMPNTHSHNSTDSGNQTSPSWVLAQEAFQQQDICLGWQHFHRGRLSRQWRAAFLQDFLSRNCHANEKQWTSGVIRALLSYSLSLWKYRCELLHGRSLEEAHRLKLSKLQHQVALAYEAYNSDPFIIRQDYRHLFSVPLDRRLNQDLDCLQCFLSTYDLAVEERVQYRKLESVTARCFFFPKSLPSTVILGSQSVSSSVSGTTVYAEMASIAAPLDTSSVDQSWTIPFSSESIPSVTSSPLGINSEVSTMQFSGHSPQSSQVPQTGYTEMATNVAPLDMSSDDHSLTFPFSSESIFSLISLPIEINSEVSTTQCSAYSPTSSQVPEVVTVIQ